nr:hypothetical protein [Tanacetum cinerariifolium]
MLNKDNYIPWSSRIIRYVRSRPNGKMIVDSIENGPYVWRMVATPGEPNLPDPIPESFHEQIDEELTENDISRMDADAQATQTILLGLPEDVYAVVDSCETAKEIWEHEKFTSTDEESIESYYHRFMQLMNNLKRNKHFPKNIAANLKFLNNLQPEWKRHVTIVRQTKNLHEADFTQIYDFLKMNQDENGGIQVAQNAGVQSGGNQNGLVVVPGIANQNGTGNIVAIRAEGSGNRNQARIQLQAEEFDFMAATGDLDEIEEVNTNCILMANLQHASTSGTQFDKAPVYDIDGSPDVQLKDNCYDNEIFIMFTQEEQYTDLLEPILEPQIVPQNDNHVTSVAPSMVQSGGIEETSSAPNEETHAHQETAYRNLVDQVAQVERLLAQLRDLKGMSSHTPSASNTLDPLNQKLETKILELEFQVVNYEREISHLKTTYKNLFDFITSNRAHAKLHNLIYENAKLRAWLFKNTSESINNNSGTSVTHQVDKPKLISIIPYSKKLHALIPSHSVPQPREFNAVKHSNVIAPGMFKIDPSQTSRENISSDTVNASSTGSLLLSKNKSIEVMSSECNNIKLPIWNDKSEIFCGTCKKCLVTANHDACVLSFVNALNSRTNNLCANVPPSANQKRHMTHVWKPKPVGFKERLACTPKPRQPRFSLKWSPSGRSFDLKGKLCVDSVCSKHMTGNIKLLTNFVWKFLGTVRFGNDHIAAILGYGDLKWGSITITRVYFIEGLGHNLFLVGQFCDADLEVAFRKNTCFIGDLDGVDLLKGNRSINIYTINLYDMASASPICLMARATPTKSWLWHQRLSHLNFDTINKLANNDLVSGLPKFKYAKEHLYPSVSKEKAKEPLTPKPVLKFQAVASAASYGFVNRTLVEAARTKFIFSYAPLILWAEAIATACYTKNRSIIHRCFNKTPYELIQGRKPDISYLHVFGALCYPKNDHEDIGKLGAKGDIGFFIGYSANYVAYRVYNRRTKKIMETMNVTFDELSTMAFEQNSSKPDLQSLTSRQISFELELTYAPLTITPQRPSERDLDILFKPLHNEYLGGQPSKAPRTVPAAPQGNHILLPTASAIDDVPNAVFEGDLFVNPFATPSTESVTKDHPLEQVIGEPSRPVLTRNQLKSDGEMCIYTLTVSILEPKSVKEALTDPAWIESMQEELHQFIRLDVWELVPSSDGIKPLTLKWLFKNKHDEENTVIHNKTHLVVNQSPSGIFLNQSNYMNEILKKYGLNTCDIIGTPMDIKDNLDLDQIGTPVDATKYRSMIGALMYLTSSRPNIVHATCDSGFELTGFSDADYVRCKDTFKSTSDGAQFLGEKLMSCDDGNPSRANIKQALELLRAPTEGYAEAIVVPPILSKHFELKHSLINMMTLDQLFGLEKDNPHDHIPHRWLEKEPPRSILTWEDLVSKFINEFFPPSRTTNLRNEISNFQQCFDELFHEDNIQGYVSAAAVNYNQGNSGYRPPSVANQIRPSGFAQPNVQNNQNRFSKPQGYNRGNNFNQDTSYQAPIQQNQVVPLSELEKIKINEANIKAMQAQIDNVKNKLRNVMKTLIQASMPLPSNTIANPKGELKAITIRSGLVLDGPSIPMPPPFINPEEDEPVILKKLPEKLGDPGKFLILCGFSELKCKALADLVINPLSGNTTSSSPNHLLEEFTDELALITFPSRNDDLPFDIESDLKEIEYFLNHDPTKEMDSIIEDSVDDGNPADPIKDLIDTIPEMFTDEHTLDYSSSPLYDDVNNDLVELESDNDDVYDDPFDSKEDKIKESKLLINELDPPRSSDFLPSLEYDSVLYEDFSEVDALPSTNNEDKKISISNASLILEDFNPPLYELPFHKEVPGSETLLSFSFENEEKVFNPEILTSKGVHTTLLPKISHQRPKAFKVIKIFESPMEIFLCSYREDIRILDVPCLQFYPP